MFSLIISIISVALVAALALASIYYGGESLDRSRIQIEASTFVQHGQTLEMAITQQRLDKNDAVVAIRDLVNEGYLKDFPILSEGNSYDFHALSDDYIWIPEKQSDELCAQINREANNVDAGGEPTYEASGSEVRLFGCNDGGFPYYKTGDLYVNETTPPA